MDASVIARKKRRNTEVDAAIHSVFDYSRLLAADAR